MSKIEEKLQKLGELLVLAGLVPQERISEGLEYARRHSLPLGRVLITLKVLREEDLESVLHSQALMKMDRLPARLAVKAITLASQSNISIDRALKKLGWFSENYIEGEAISLTVACDQLSNCQSTFGIDHPETAAACLKLAELLTDNRKYADAESLYKRAAKIVEECFGPQSLHMAQIFSKLGAHYFAQDLFEQAEKNYWQAYEITLSLLGDRDLRVAQCLENLAELYDVQSEYLQAERLYLSSVGIKEKLLEADDPALLASLRKLVQVCRQCEYTPERKQTGELLVDAGLVKKARIAEGLKLSQEYNVPIGRALITLNELSKEDLQRTLQAQLLMKDGNIPGYIIVRALKTACRLNISVSIALKKIGWKNEQTGDPHHLEVLLRCSDELIKLEHELTPAHIDVARKCVDLSELYASANSLREAEVLLKRALASYEKHFGHDSLSTCSVLSNLAQISGRQNRWDEANSYIDRAVSLARKTSSPAHPGLSEYLQKQARILSACGRAKEALLVMQELLPRGSKIKRGDNIYVSQLLELQGDIYVLEKEFSSAAESYAQSLILRRKTEEGGSPPITGLLNKLGEAEMKQGKSEAALQHFKEGQSATSKLLGDHHPLMALAELNIANCLAVMKNHEEARNSYQKALKIMEHTAGENHEGTASVLEEYSSYLKTCGQDEEAREIDKRIASIRENPDSRHTAINLKAVN